MTEQIIRRYQTDERAVQRHDGRATSEIGAPVETETGRRLLRLVTNIGSPLPDAHRRQ